MSYGYQALKLIIGLIVLTLTLRILGKQNMAQMTPYDVVYIIVFGGILDSTFYDDGIDIKAFIFSTVVWSLSIYIIEFLVRESETLRMFFRGKPDQIMENGKLNMKLFNKNNIDFEELRMILRQKGIFSLKEVKDVFIETDGNFSVIKYMDYQEIVNSALNLKVQESYPNILLIDEGEIEIRSLKSIEKSKQWLVDEMKALGINDISKVLYCEWSEIDGFYYKLKGEIPCQS